MSIAAVGVDQGVNPVVASFTAKAPTIKMTSPMITNVVNGRMPATILAA